MVKRFWFFLHLFVLVVTYLYGGNSKSIHSGSSYLKLIYYVLFFILHYIYESSLFLFTKYCGMYFRCTSGDNCVIMDRINMCTCCSENSRLLEKKAKWKYELRHWISHVWSSHTYTSNIGHYLSSVLWTSKRTLLESGWTSE